MRVIRIVNSRGGLSFHARLYLSTKRIVIVSSLSTGSTGMFQSWVHLVTSSVFTSVVSFGYFLRENPLDKIPGKVASFGVIARTARNRSVFSALNDLCTPNKEAEILDSLSRRVYEKLRRSPVKLD
jgi:hypothetical protein